MVCGNRHVLTCAASLLQAERQDQHKQALGAMYIRQVMLSAASAVRKRQDDVLGKPERKSYEVASILKTHHSTASRFGHIHGPGT